MTTELRDALDRSFDDGPVHLPIETRLTAGRAAVRRRRLAMAASATAVAAVAALAAPDLLPKLASERSVLQAATEGVSSEPTTPAGTPPSLAPDYWGNWDSPEHASIISHYNLATGELMIRPGVRVLERIDNPAGFAPSEGRSAALIVDRDGSRWWSVAQVSKPTDPGWSSAMSNETEPIAGSIFKTWVAEQLFLMNQPDGAPTWIRLHDDGRLIARGGAEIIEQRSPARPDQAPEERPSAQAMVRVDGVTLCVMARSLAGSPDYVVQGEADHQGCFDTMEGWHFEGNAASGYQE